MSLYWGEVSKSSFLGGVDSYLGGVFSFGGCTHIRGGGGFCTSGPPADTITRTNRKWKLEKALKEIP